MTQLPDALVEMDVCTNSLSGTLPILPKNLKSLNLCINFISQPSYPFSDSLVYVNLYHNWINASLTFPPYIVVFYGNSNLFHGEIPQLPISMTKLGLDDNKLSGSISNLTYYHVQPNSNSQLTLILLNFNNIIGNIPKLPSKLEILSLYGTLMSGPIGILPDSLTDLELNGQLFTGTIYMKRPTVVHLSNTLIDDVVIQDTSQLTDCDICNMSMLNNPNIISLFPFCVHSNLPQFDNITKYDASGLTHATGMTSQQLFNYITTMKSLSGASSGLESLKMTLQSSFLIVTRNIRDTIDFTQSSTSLLVLESSTIQTDSIEITSTDFIYQFHVSPISANLGYFTFIRSLVNISLVTLVLTKTPWKKIKSSHVTSLTI
eukprot:NODE_415_length_7892_cov_0.421917.p3 type:complete len:375 gc:universal NODE_415_length_7892_cov_0.421917:3574-2450(-)